MKTNIAHWRLEAVVTLLGLVMGSSAVLAAQPPCGQTAAPTKEQREKMATIHEQMATCLRSDKPVADCHKEAMKNCQDTMGKNGCSMMGGMGGMHDHMMHGQSSKKKD